jgi:hypothetical protein
MGRPRRPRFTSSTSQSGRSSTSSSRIARILWPSQPRSSLTRLRTSLLVRTRLETSKWLSTYRAGSKLIDFSRHYLFRSLAHAFVFRTMCRTRNRSKNQHEHRHKKSHAGTVMYILVDHPQFSLFRSGQVFGSALRPPFLMQSLAPHEALRCPTPSRVCPHSPTVGARSSPLHNTSAAFWHRFEVQTFMHRSIIVLPIRSGDPPSSSRTLD